MNRSSEKIQDILGYLSNQLARGWLFFLVAKYVYQAFQSSQITSARHFFAATYLSCIESAILALSRLAVPHSDSISIEYLLNCSAQSPKAFPRAQKEVVLNSVSEHRQQLKAIGSLIANVKEQRDQTIAHLDRKYVNNPSAIFSSPPLDMREIERTFVLLLRIINTYKRYLDSSELFLNFLAPNVRDELEYLIGLIEKDNERP